MTAGFKSRKLLRSVLWGILLPLLVPAAVLASGAHETLQATLSSSFLGQGWLVLPILGLGLGSFWVFGASGRGMVSTPVPGGASQGGGSWLQMMRKFSPNAKLFLTYALLSSLGTGIWRVMFNLYLLALGFNLEYIGTVVAINLFFHGFMAFPAGLIADKVGRRTTFVIASVLALGRVGHCYSLLTPSPFWC